MHVKPISQRNLKRLARKAAVTCGGVALAVNTGAIALGLGSPEVQSYLAQPLKLRIPLRLDAQDSTPDAYTARILPPDAYPGLSELGQDYQTNDFRIRLTGNNNSGYWLYITSNRSIREPILSLLFEVRNPSVRIIQSVDVLLDPATQASKDQLALSSAPKRKLSKSVADDIGRPSKAGLPQMSYLSGAAPVAHLIGMANPPHTGGTTHFYGPVRPGESLSRIAQRARLNPNTPLVDMMSAIYEANPQHFRGNYNALKLGSVLAIPKMSSVGLPSERVSTQIAQQQAPATTFQYSAPTPALSSSTEPASLDQAVAFNRPVKADSNEVSLANQTRYYVQGQRLALDFNLQNSVPVSQLPTQTSPVSPIALSANLPQIDLQAEKRLGNEIKSEAAVVAAISQASTDKQQNNPIWAWLMALCAGAIVAALRYRYLWKQSLDREIHLDDRQPSKDNVAAAPNNFNQKPSAPEQYTITHKLDRSAHLHLRITALLADKPTAENRAMAKLALTHLENDELDKAEALVDGLESTLASDDEFRSHPKIVKLKSD